MACVDLLLDLIYLQTQQFTENCIQQLFSYGYAQVGDPRKMNKIGNPGFPELFLCLRLVFTRGNVVEFFK